MALKAAIAGLSAFQKVGLALSAASAVGQIQAGRARARAYETQAKAAELQGRRQALKYQQDGIQVLRNTRQNISTVTARAAAGGIAPYSGTPRSLQLYAQSTGTEEFYLTRENAQLAEVTGDINRQQFESAASQARRQGFMNAVGTLGQAAFTVGSIGTTPTSATNASGLSQTASYSYNVQPPGQLSIYNPGF